jgi:Restriction endonuclease
VTLNRILAGSSLLSWRPWELAVETAVAGENGIHDRRLTPDHRVHKTQGRSTGPRIKVQVKRRESEKVSAESLRAFMAVLGDQDVGIYISAAGFSPQAEREARSQEKRRLKLTNLERFVELWVQRMQQLPDQDRRRLPLKPVYFLGRGAVRSGIIVTNDAE